MATHLPLREAILMVLQTGPTWELDDLVRACPEFTWNQIFLELDRLSRSGEVRMTREPRAGYRITVLSPEGQPHNGHCLVESSQKRGRPF